MVQKSPSKISRKSHAIYASHHDPGMSQSSIIVQVDHLRKLYRETVALDDCSLEIPRGQVYGLLGPNGAGKTTLIRSLLGFIQPTSGKALVDGCDCRFESLRVRRRTAYLPAEAKLFRMMRGEAALDFFSRIHPTGSLDRARQLANRLQLDLTRRVAFMSTGMRQKLAIACILSCRAPLLILDEPTASLDPSVRKEVLAIIREANADGCTILFSSHILSEIEEVCDHASIVSAGRVVESIDIHRMRQRYRARLTLPTTHPGLMPNDLPAKSRVVAMDGPAYLLELDGSLEDFLPWLARLQPLRLSLEPIGLKHLYESCIACS
jgi:ABC-2 type transport system ATP-binding protein